MKRWVGFGVIADNLINIGRAHRRPLSRTLISILPLPSYPAGRKAATDLLWLRGRRFRGSFEKLIFAPESN